MTVVKIVSFLKVFILYRSVIVSGGQQRDSVVHIHVAILIKIWTGHHLGYVS